MRNWLSFDPASRSAGLLVAGRAIGFVSAFAIPVVLARLFDQTEFGTYKQLFLIYGTLFGLAQLGIAESLYYFVPRDEREAGRHVANALVTLAVSGALCIGSMAIAGGAIAQWLSNPDLARFIVALGLFLGLMLMSAPFEIALVSRGRAGAAALTYALSDIGRTLFIVVPAALVGSIHGLLAGAIAFAAIRLMAMLAVLWREFRGGARLDLSVWRVQLAYALPFALAVGIEVVQATLPQYVVASRFDAATFAIFAVGCLQIPIVDVIATSSGNIMMVRLAGDTRGGLALWHDAISRLAFLIVPLTAFLIVAAEPVILTLFTARYLESAPIFALWTLTLLPAVFVVDSVLRAYAETRVLFLLNVFRLAIVAASIGAAVSAFGLIGAVVVTLAGTVLSRAIGLVRIARLLRVGAREVLPWGRLAIITAWTLVASISSAALVNHSAWPPLGRLMAGGLVFGAVYAAMCAGSVRLEQILSERPGLLRRGVSA